MRRLLLFAFFLIAITAHANAKQPDLSIAGLTIRSSIDSITSKLGTDYHKAVTATVHEGEVVNFTNGLEGFNVLAQGGKTVYIEHQEFSAPKGLISTDELAKDLSGKYGPPSFKNEDDQSEAWIIIGDKPVAASAMTDLLRACVNYDMQGPFFTSSNDNVSFAFQFPRVPVQEQYIGCGTVIEAHPKIIAENRGLLSQLTVSIFDVKAAQAWYDAAMADYNKAQKDAVDAARKNKPHL